MALAGPSAGSHHAGMSFSLQSPSRPGSAADRDAAPAPAAVAAITLWADDRATALAWQAALRPEGLEVLPVEQPRADAAAHLLVLQAGLALHLARLREHREAVPALPLLLACPGLRDLDQVLALEIGADDVIDAAVSAPVVAARLRALWRRREKPGGPTSRIEQTARELRFGALRLAGMGRRVVLDGREVQMSEGEFEVLWLLASQAGRAVSRSEILRRVRGLEDHPTDRSIDSRVYRIRAKLGEPGKAAAHIRTVRNFGYAFSTGAGA
jgi:two-component system, OmpR family, response regulator RstA